MRLLLLVFGMILFSSELLATKVVVINHVSISRQSFVASLGVEDGILFGQKSLFTTGNFSFVAKAVKVNRFMSLWEPADPSFQVPFNQGELVVYNNDREGIYKEIPELKLEYDRITELQQKYLEKRDLFYDFTLLTSAISSIAESASLAEETQESTRTGLHFTLFYNKRLTRKITLSLGGRYDTESLKINDPALTIPTKRYFGLARVSYSFINEMKPASYFFYGAATLGYGKNENDYEVTTTKGTSIILPQIVVGAQMRFLKETALIFEGGMELIKSTEAFPDGQEQQVNVLNTNFTVGLSF